MIEFLNIIFGIFVSVETNIIILNITLYIGLLFSLLEQICGIICLLEYISNNGIEFETENNSLKTQVIQYQSMGENR